MATDRIHPQLQNVLPEQVIESETRSRIFLLQDAQDPEWQSCQEQYHAVLTRVAEGCPPPPRRIAVLDKEAIQGKLVKDADFAKYNFLGGKSTASISVHRGDSSAVDFFAIVLSWALKMLSSQASASSKSSTPPNSVKFGVAIADVSSQRTASLLLVKCVAPPPLLPPLHDEQKQKPTATTLAKDLPSSALLGDGEDFDSPQWFVCGLIDMQLAPTSSSPAPYSRVYSTDISWNPRMILAGYERYLKCCHELDDDSFMAPTSSFSATARTAPPFSKDADPLPPSCSALSYIIHPYGQKPETPSPRPPKQSSASAPVSPQQPQHHSERSFMYDPVSTTFPVLLKRLPWVSPVHLPTEANPASEAIVPPLREQPTSSQTVRLPSLEDLGLSPMPGNTEEQPSDPLSTFFPGTGQKFS